MPPASPPPSFGLHSTETLSQSPIVNCEHNYLLLKLCDQCITISVLLQSKLNRTEYNFLYNALCTTVKQTHIFSSIQNLSTLYKTCIFFSQKLWKLLRHPYTSKIRHQIITFITILDVFITTYIQPHLDTSYVQRHRRTSDTFSR